VEAGPVRRGGAAAPRLALPRRAWNGVGSRTGTWEVGHAGQPAETSVIDGMRTALVSRAPRARRTPSCLRAEA
jgi:hypothetical protein